MTIKQKWADSCLASGYEIYPLEERNGVQLFSLRQKATDDMIKKGYAYTWVGYAIWHDNEHWDVVMDYQEALSVYRRATDEKAE